MDDDPINQNVVCSIFNSSGFEVGGRVLPSRSSSSSSRSSRAKAIAALPVAAMMAVASHLSHHPCKRGQPLCATILVPSEAHVAVRLFGWRALQSLSPLPDPQK